MTLTELLAYHDRVAKANAKRSSAQSKILAQNERARKVLVRVGKGDRVVAVAETNERVWSGVPRDIPQDCYPNKRKRRHYVDMHAKHTTTRKAPREIPEAKAAVILDLRATDGGGRSPRPERSERIMRDALKDYGRSEPVAVNSFQQWFGRVGISQA